MDEDDLFINEELPEIASQVPQTRSNQEEKDNSSMPAPSTPREPRTRTKKSTQSSAKKSRTTRSLSNQRRRAIKSTMANQAESADEAERLGSYTEDSPANKNLIPPKQTPYRVKLGPMLASCQSPIPLPVPFSPSISTVSPGKTPAEVAEVDLTISDSPDPPDITGATSDAPPASSQTIESSELSENALDIIVQEMYNAKLNAYFRHNIQAEEASKLRNNTGCIPAKTFFDLVEKRAMVIGVQHPKMELTQVLTAIVYEGLIPLRRWIEHAEKWSSNIAINNTEDSFAGYLRLMEKTKAVVRKKYPNNPTGNRDLEACLERERKKMEALEGRSFFSQPSQTQSQQQNENTYKENI